MLCQKIVTDFPASRGRRLLIKPIVVRSRLRHCGANMIFGGLAVQGLNDATHNVPDDALGV